MESVRSVGRLDNPGHLVVRGIDFRCDALIGRPEWLPNIEASELARLGRCLVTGGGGSIGGELARWLAGAGVPLVVADVDEDRLYEISGELGAAAQYQLLDVCDPRQVRQLMRRVRPRSVFHLAAKKHVRFVQGAARAAFMANAIGTMNVIEASAELDPGTRVTLTSSDKAAMPQNLVGLTKRTAEEVVGSYAVQEGVPSRALRFPNVLGTAGGVLDHYVREGVAGRPLDVWSANMSRYFCCVHEAVRALVLVTLSEPSTPLAIFDVGQPTPIADLATVAASSLCASGHATDVIVSERFESVHARHETLLGPEERWQESEQTPRIAAIDRAFRPFSGLRETVIDLARSDRSDAELEDALWLMHAAAAARAS